MTITQNPGNKILPANITVAVGDTLTFEDDAPFEVQINGPAPDVYDVTVSTAGADSQYAYTTTPAFANAASYSVSYGTLAGTNQIIITPSGGTKKKGR